MLADREWKAKNNKLIPIKKERIMSDVLKVIKNPYKLLYWGVRKSRFLTRFLSDKVYLKLAYRSVFGKKLNLENPVTFNEKLQWLKLYDRKPIYTTMVDKYEAKKYVAELLGEEYIIPTLGVWDDFDEINFDSLPNQFVLKCTHDSGGLVICKDKRTLDIAETKNKIERCLKNNFYYMGREWPYKNVKPRIIAEKYLVDKSTNELMDYKFFCFGGQVRCFKVDFDRFVDHHANYYDVNRNLLDLGEEAYPPISDKKIDFPSNLDEMIHCAEVLSQTIPFMRADFYDVNGKVYFGEMTFYPASGFGKISGDKWDEKLGTWISIGGGQPNLSSRYCCDNSSKKK